MYPKVKVRQEEQHQDDDEYHHHQALGLKAFLSLSSSPATVGEKDDSLRSISVQLNEQNYSCWSYVLKNFLKGKRMWGYVSGTFVKPEDEKNGKYENELETWEVNNLQIITWINNSVSQSIGVQLAKYETAKEVWDHLKKLFGQSNFAKQYQLEIDIRALQQNNMSIQEFYSAISNLWDQLALTESEELRALKSYIDHREKQRLVQFFMALRDDFEELRRTILHRNPLPTVDSVVNELLVEEIRLKSQSEKGIVEKGILLTPNSFVFPISSNKGKSHGRVSYDDCSFCKQRGHWKTQCPKLLSRSQQPQQPSQWRPSPNQLSQRKFKLPSSNVVAQPHAMSVSFNIGKDQKVVSMPSIAKVSKCYVPHAPIPRVPVTEDFGDCILTFDSSGSSGSEKDGNTDENKVNIRASLIPRVPVTEDFEDCSLASDSSGSGGPERDSNTDENKVNIRASSIPRHRAVMSSPDNDMMIGNRNRVRDGRLPASKNGRLQSRHAHCKVKPHDTTTEIPPDTRKCQESGSKDKIDSVGKRKVHKGNIKPENLPRNWKF